MRIACLALTDQAAALAITICPCLDGTVDIYLPERLRGRPEFQAGAAFGQRYFAKFSQVVPEIFDRYDALVFIMATGIVVRTLAPLLVRPEASKLTDPAVLVLDERGRHVISLLSGHVGGANQLTYDLATAIEADPVITTATDTEKKLAPDMLANMLSMRPLPHDNIVTVNTAVLQGARVDYYIDLRMAHAAYFYRCLRSLGQKVHKWNPQLALEEASDSGVAVFLVANPEDAPDSVSTNRRQLVLVPRRLIAGVGCRRGTTEVFIRQALSWACQRINVDISFINQLATTQVKANELGIIEVSEHLDIDIEYFDNEELEAAIERYGLQESEFVRKTIGVGNVCEAAALAATGEKGGRFALTKTKFEKVTVALLWEK